MNYDTTYTRPVDIKKLDFIHWALAGGKANGAIRTVLELGCGEGAIATTLLNDYEVVGVELFESEATVARSKGVTVEIADACTWNGGRLFDAVVASEVIEHLIDPAALARNARAHLVPGGMFIVTTPNGFGPFELRSRHLNPVNHLRHWNWLRQKAGKAQYVKGGLDHAQFFTQQRLIDTVVPAGFILGVAKNSDFLTGGSWDIEVAKHLPPWLASGWYFAFQAV